MSASEEKARLREADDDEPSSAPQAIPPTRSLPGHATAAALARGLQVPTHSRLVTSGFPYPDVLGAHDVSPADWARFTAEITAAAHLTAGDWALSLGGGTGTLLVAGLFVGWFGLIPAYFVGRRLHERLEQRNLELAKTAGPLEQQLLAWNEDFFAPRGLLIRLDLPGDHAGLDAADMDVYNSWGKGRGGRCGGGGARAWKMNDRCAAKMEKHRAKIEAKMTKHEAKIEHKMAKHEDKLRRMVGRKGRIVIIPINGAAAAAPAADRTTASETEKEKDMYSASVV